LSVKEAKQYYQLQQLSEMNGGFTEEVIDRK